MARTVLEIKQHHHNHQGESTVIKVICVDHKNDTLVIRCWKPSARMARIEWYEAQKMMEVPHGSLFPREESVRVGSKRRMSRSHRCHFGNDVTVPRPLQSTKTHTTQPKRIQEAITFCQTQTADYIPRHFTDGTYKETDHDLYSVFESTAVEQHAAASVVILHDGQDWEKRSAFEIHITDGDMIGTRSAKIQLHH